MEARNKRDESNIVWSSAHTMRGPTTLGYRTFRQALIRNLWNSELNPRWNALSSLQSISGAKAQQIPDKNQKSNPFYALVYHSFAAAASRCGWMSDIVLIKTHFRMCRYMFGLCVSCTKETISREREEYRTQDESK